MADPRFNYIAQRIGHVYLSRQGLEPELDGNLMATMSRVELFRSTLLGPMDPREFLNTFFADWAKYYGKYGKRVIARPYSIVPPTAAYRQFIVDPLVSRCHCTHSYFRPLMQHILVLCS